MMVLVEMEGRSRTQRRTSASQDVTRNRTLRVLLVDDDEMLRKYVRRLLERQGMRVVEATTGEEGYLAAVSGRPDIVLLDWMLPDREGLEVLQMLKADLRTAPIPVIVVTGSLDPSTQVRAMGAGAVAFINKPWPRGALQTEIRRALRLTNP